MQLLGNQAEGKVFIISAPEGTGKTTLATMLMQEFPCIVRSVSYTTRPKRKTEQEGKDYFFVTPEEFEKRKKAGDFLETAIIYGHAYGTSTAHLEKLIHQGKHVLLIINAQGSKQLRGKIDAVRIFLTPPSLEELEQRLKKRETESPASLQQRLDFARRGLQTKDQYDYHIVNDDVNRAYAVLRAIIIAEEYRIK